MAAVVDVGIPKVSKGIKVAVTAALLAASGPATPSIAPTVPKSFFILSDANFFSVA